MNGFDRTVRAGTAMMLCALIACHEPYSESRPHTNGQSTATETPTRDAPDMNTDPTHERTNRLIHATSPYLLQHARNPVDWYEWGEEAFDKARSEQKPIFLSVGYAACHWCHVMEHESFESEEIADILNRYFVCIKVDREERPDVDEIYMQATMAMNNGSGGWPMSVFLTPDRAPFFAGTYFPPEQFTRLIDAIAEAWSDRRDDLLMQSAEVRKYLLDWATVKSNGQAPIAQETVVDTARTLSRYFDSSLGGFAGQQNKFPPSMAMELMLRVYRRTGDESLLRDVQTTLDHMAYGGIYDQLGGGICRYSTDPQWRVPHFEKMLYDQALVGSIYLDAYQVTGKPLYARTASGILDYVIADLQSPEGGFYSTRDADSEGLEGKYYIWTRREVKDILGEGDAELFCAYYDVTEGGNWFESMGHAPAGAKSILNVRKAPELFCQLHGMDVDELERRLSGMRAKMLEARDRRVPPGLDDKILTAWNGLIIASLAKGAAVLNEPKYAEAAARAADFVLDRLQQDGRLLRTHRNGTSRLTGYLTDYAFFIEGLLNLYESTFDPRWLEAADALARQSIRHYFDEQGGAFFFTASDGETLIARTKNPRDGALPSGNSVHAMNLLRLAILLHNKDYRAKAESIFATFAPMAENSPGAFERLLCSVDFYHAPTQEIAVIGPPDDQATRQLLAAVHATFRPNKVVALAPRPDAPATRMIPMLKNKTMRGGKPTVYVCRNFSCKTPVTTPEELTMQLDAK